MEVKTILL